MKDMDIKNVVENQRSFYHTGATKDVEYRKQALRRLRISIEVHEAQIEAALKEDLGKSGFESYATEIGFAYSEISYMLKHIDKFAKPKRKPTPLLNFPSKSVIYQDPYGIVLIMSPWNYPFQLTIAPLVGAIAAGNCAVIKPSNYSPNVSNIIKKVIEEAFDSQYVHVVTGGRDANQSLLEQKFDYIFFTGGKIVGRQVMAAASEHLTPVTLELGGKSPCIVDSTAKIPLAARRIVWGKLLNCGQTCVAPDYILVHSSVKEKLLSALTDNIKALYGDDPINSKDYPKIVNRKHFDRLTAILQGEELYYGGEIREDRCKIGPAIIDNASWEKTKAMQEEIFGPIIPVLTFDDLDEVRQQVNQRPSPLALYLFTESKEAKDFVLRNIAFGGGCINDTIMHLATSNMPFGGVGESGMGGYHGKESFFTFSHSKSVLAKSTIIDVPLRYPPYSDSTKSVRMFLK